MDSLNTMSSLNVLRRPALLFLDEDLSNDSRLGVVTLNTESLSNFEPLQVIGYGLNMSEGVRTDTVEYADQWFINDSFCEMIFEDAFEFNGTSNFTVYNYTSGIVNG